jgi:hypothetical protein
MLYSTAFRSLMAILLCLFLLSCEDRKTGAPATVDVVVHKYFTKENIDCDFQSRGVNKYYKLVFVNDSIGLFKCGYYYDFDNFSDSEKVEMIGELLSYEGDTSLCSKRVACYNVLVSMTVPREIKYYSIQVEALFIINHILLKQPYMFSAFPILRNRGGEPMESVRGPLVEKAYASYKEWFKLVKKNGLKDVVSKKILPLGDNAAVSWLM